MKTLHEEILEELLPLLSMVSYEKDFRTKLETLIISALTRVRQETLEKADKVLMRYQEEIVSEYPKNYAEKGSSSHDDGYADGKFLAISTARDKIKAIK